MTLFDIIFLIPYQDLQVHVDQCSYSLHSIHRQETMPRHLHEILHYALW